MNIEDWPNCPVADCENKICIWAGGRFCYRCYKTLFGQEHMDKLYVLTHTDGKLNPEIEGIDA